MANECTEFEIKVKVDIPTVFDEVVATAAKNKLVITGDVTKGKVKHKTYKMEGTYRIKGQSIFFKLVEDDWVVTCSNAEEAFREALKGYC